MGGGCVRAVLGGVGLHPSPAMLLRKMGTTGRPGSMCIDGLVYLYIYVFVCIFVCLCVYIFAAQPSCCSHGWRGGWVPTPLGAEGKNPGVPTIIFTCGASLGGFSLVPVQGWLFLQEAIKVIGSRGYPHFQGVQVQDPPSHPSLLAGGSWEGNKRVGWPLRSACSGKLVPP